MTSWVVLYVSGSLFIPKQACMGAVFLNQSRSKHAPGRGLNWTPCQLVFNYLMYQKFELSAFLFILLMTCRPIVKTYYKMLHIVPHVVHPDIHFHRDVQNTPVLRLIPVPDLGQRLGGMYGPRLLLADPYLGHRGCLERIWHNDGGEFSLTTNLCSRKPYKHLK